MLNPHHYFLFCTIVQQEGSLAFVAVNDFGASKQMDKFARAEYAKQDRRGKDMSYNIGSMIGSGIRYQKHRKEQAKAGSGAKLL